MKRLTLKDAIRTKRLEAFVAQEESRGAPSGDMAAFDKALKAAIKTSNIAFPISRWFWRKVNSFTYFCM